MDSLMVNNYQCQEIINTDRVSYLDKILTNYYRKKWRGFKKIWNLFKKNNSLRVVNKYGALFNLNPSSYMGFKIKMLARHENNKHNLENFIAVR